MNWIPAQYIGVREGFSRKGRPKQIFLFNVRGRILELHISTCTAPGRAKLQRTLAALHNHKEVLVTNNRVLDVR